MATVLVVEDERKLRELLRTYLEHDGLTVLSTASGAEAIRLTRDTTPDLLVLDLRLPDVPDEEVAREVRQFSRVPILVLTAKTATDDRIHCLELGADDYVTKPFSPREVILRIRAILRRAHSGLVDDPPTSYGDGELVLDEPHRQALVRGHPVQLTTTEWRLLTTLAGAPGRVFSRYELINRTRGYEFEGYERTVDSHIRNLRHKPEADPHGPRIVQTVVGAGYRFGLRHDRPRTSQQATGTVGAAVPRRRPREDEAGRPGGEIGWQALPCPPVKLATPPHRTRGRPAKPLASPVASRQASLTPVWA